MPGSPRRLVLLAGRHLLLDDWSTKSRRWCARCLDQARTAALLDGSRSSLGPWHRALWDVHSVAVRPTHRIVLSGRCHVCGRHQDFRRPSLDRRPWAADPCAASTGSFGRAHRGASQAPPRSGPLAGLSRRAGALARCRREPAGVGRRSIEDFGRRYVACASLARSAGTSSRKLADVLGHHGVEPASGRPDRRQLLYERATLPPSPLQWKRGGRTRRWSPTAPGSIK